jgi:hypothetical protein
MHRLELKKVPVPVQAPEGAAQRLRQAVPVGVGSQPYKDIDGRAKEFLNNNPDIANWIRTLMGVSVLAVVIVAIILLVAPAAGAVLATFAFAAALVRAAA